MIKGHNSDQKLGGQVYATLQQVGGGRIGADMIPRAVAEIAAVAAPTGGTRNSLEFAGHTARIGDAVRFQAGVNSLVEVAVIAVDANNIYFNHKFDAAIVAADTFSILRYLTLTLTTGGALVTNAGALQFNKDGSVVEVTKDTATPGNTIALPVEIVAASGTEINITAGEINVQLTHTGANPDSTQIGDGTTLLGITLANEAKTFDATTHTALTTLNAKDFATEVSLAAVLAKIIAAPATEAKQDAGIVELQAILAKQSADPSTSTLQTAGNGTLTNILAKIIAAPSTEAKQDTSITALNSILAKIIAAPSTEAKQDIIITALDLLTAEAGLAPNHSHFIDTTVTPIPATGSFLQLAASAPSAIRKVQTFDTTGGFIGVYVGAAAAETLRAIIGPGSNETIMLNIEVGDRVTLSSMTATAITSGELALNAIG